MTPEETELFEILDQYAREQHKCFLAEMFLNKEQTEYVLCFRPTNAEKDSQSRYDCRYVRIGATEASAVGKQRALDSRVVDQLDRELKLLRKS